MSLVLVIYDELDNHPQELVMSDSNFDFDGSEKVGLVYQDTCYKYELYQKDESTIIKKIQLYINNEPSDISYRFDATTDRYLISHQYIAKPFLLHFGLVQISILITFSDNREVYYFSPFMAVGIKTYEVKLENSVNDMLDYVYKKEHELLYRGNPHNFSKLPQYIRNPDNKIIEEIELLKSIVVTIDKQLPYFYNSPHRRLTAEMKVDRFEKLRSIRNDNIRYIATHPEELQRSYSARSILLNGRGFEPTRTLIEEKKHSTNTYENQAILSFIYTLTQHIDNRIKEVQCVLKKNPQNLKVIRTVRPDYTISYAVIQKYVQTTFGDYLFEYSNINKKLHSLLVSYHSALDCNYTLLTHIPRPTSVFMEIYHYRNIYEVMNIWFGYGKNTAPVEYMHSNFTSADRIYEYYCLISLYDIIVKLGFTLRHDGQLRYAYKSPSIRYQQDDEDNTYIFTKGNKELTLYYQPVVYSSVSRTNNNISLFRTDENYYIPDFIIKVTSLQRDESVDSPNVIYGILDAKWRKRTSLTNKYEQGSIYDLIYKYYYSIRDRNTGKSPSFLWLLQGKDDSSRNPPFIHNSGSISNSLGDKFKYSSAILQVTPAYGNQDLIDALRIFLE